MIQVKNVTKQVESPSGTLTILEDISFHINKGESVAILGPSGSGKSTLLSLMAGLDTPTHGDVMVAGQQLNRRDEDQRAKLRAELIGFVFQNFNLLPNLTALENAVLPLELAGDSAAQVEGEKLLSTVGLTKRGKHYPHQLSGGEQQRVAIARAFIKHPALLFADEPTGNLDQKTGEQIMELLFNLNKRQHTTLIMVTHDFRLARACTRQLTLDHGRLVHG